MRRHCDRVWAERIVEGWVPGSKRKHLDLLDHDNTLAPDPRLAELTRPHRQFREDSWKNNKPHARKRKNTQCNAKYINWQTPVLWSQIEELHKTNLKDFWRLTEQVIGQWIDCDGQTNKWADTVLQKVALGSGNVPGGHTMRCWVLYPNPATRKKIHDHVTSLRGVGVLLTLLTIRTIMVVHIETDTPELFIPIGWESVFVVENSRPPLKHE
ncbi:hypothetical protein B0H10DRAFT_2211074 [Mycena sp. CBHHK59/15]|nr:hypothetical protein B0H10DRAFT_2211074 [Mycena sp. CBHHK59/15]